MAWEVASTTKPCDYIVKEWAKNNFPNFAVFFPLFTHIQIKKEPDFLIAGSFFIC